MRIIRMLIALGALGAVVGCASVPENFNDTAYSRTEISTVAATHFSTKEKALYKALKPTFEKYRQPNGYIAGQMSASLDDRKDRLLGTGAFQAKFQMSKGTYWEIGGTGLAGIFKPMPAMHLVYKETDIAKFKSILIRSNVILRKGQTFTVFEQKIDDQVLVTVYRTADIPVSSNLQTLKFAPVYRGGLLP